MARLPDLVAFAQRHALKIGTISDLIAYRRRHDNLVRETAVRHGHLRIRRRLADARLRRHRRRRRAHRAGQGRPRRRPSRCWCACTRSTRSRTCSASIPAAPTSCATPCWPSPPRAAAWWWSCATCRSKLDLGDHVSPHRLRQYGIGAQILNALGLHELILLTNSPSPRVVGLDGYGLAIAGTRPIPPAQAPDDGAAATAHPGLPRPRFERPTRLLLVVAPVLPRHRRRAARRRPRRRRRRRRDASETVEVPGALEIPTAIRLASRSARLRRLRRARLRDPRRDHALRDGLQRQLARADAARARGPLHRQRHPDRREPRPGARCAPTPPARTRAAARRTRRMHLIALARRFAPARSASAGASRGGEDLRLMAAAAPASPPRRRRRMRSAARLYAVQALFQMEAADVGLETVHRRVRERTASAPRSTARPMPRPTSTTSARCSPRP